MSRQGRIISVITATDADRRLDFWAAILHAIPDNDSNLIGDMVEGREEEPLATRVVQALGHRFEGSIKALSRERPHTDGEGFLVRMVAHDLSSRPAAYLGDLEYFAQMVRTSVPKIVKLNLQSELTPIGDLAPGRKFRHLDGSVVGTVGRHRPDGNVEVLSSTRSGLDLMRPTVPVYPEPELPS